MPDIPASPSFAVAARRLPVPPPLLAAVVLSVGLAPVPGRAQTGPTLVPPVLVSATRSEQSTVSSPAAIVTIDREAIEASGANDLSEVLRGLGGVQVVDLYGDGRRASFSMRGFSSETANANVLVLVDGRRLNNTDIRNPDLSALNLADIERIEVIQGSAGTLYGDQAVGGVINIITRRPRGHGGFVEVEAGSYDRKGIGAGYQRKLDSGFGYRLAVVRNETDNYREHNAAEHSNLSTRLDYDYASGTVFFEYQYVDDTLQTPGSLFADELAVDRRQSVADYTGDFSDTLTKAARIGVNQSLDDHWSLEAEATRRSVDGDFRLSFRGFPATGDNVQNSKLTSFNPRLIGSYELAHGELLLTLGLDHEQTDYFIESQFAAQSNAQTTRSVYLQAVAPVAPGLQVTLGGRAAELENDSIDPFAGLPNNADLDDSQSVYELGLSWSPSESTRLFARLDENYRFVKFDEQSQANGVVLDTQTGTSRELGLAWTGTAFSSQVVVYRLDLDNELGFDPTSFINFNLDRTRRQGLNLDLVVRTGPKLRLGLGLGWVDAEDVSDAGSGNRIPMVARTSARLTADLAASARLHLHGEIQYVGDRILSGDFDNDLQPLPSYTLANLALRWRQGMWELAARINNLFDEDYIEFGSLAFGQDSYLPSPERNFVLSAKARF